MLNLTAASTAPATFPGCFDPNDPEGRICGECAECRHLVELRFADDSDREETFALVGAD